MFIFHYSSLMCRVELGERITFPKHPPSPPSPSAQKRKGKIKRIKVEQHISKPNHTSVRLFWLQETN